jgi:hypothetical protein
MWPFSTPGRARGDPDELALSSEELLLSLKRRVTALELQHEDLAAAYKRLRGSRAGEQVALQKVPPSHQGDLLDAPEGPDDPREPGWKDAMRRRHLHKPGNGS